MVGNIISSILIWFISIYLNVSYFYSKYPRLQNGKAISIHEQRNVLALFIFSVLTGSILNLLSGRCQPFVCVNLCEPINFSAGERITDLLTVVYFLSRPYSVSSSVAYCRILNLIISNGKYLKYQILIFSGFHKFFSGNFTN